MASLHEKMTGLGRLAGGRAVRGGNLTDKQIKFLAAGLGAGLVPKMPGTAGTFVGIPLFLIFSLLPVFLQLISVLALTALGCYIARRAERIWEKRDPPQIVIDEITGLQWTLLLVPPTVSGILWGFLFFRFFDILKPPPIKWLERKLTGGYGIMADDLAAALYARFILEGANHILGLY